MTLKYLEIHGELVQNHGSLKMAVRIATRCNSSKNKVSCAQGLVGNVGKVSDLGRFHESDHVHVSEGNLALMIAVEIEFTGQTRLHGAVLQSEHSSQSFLDTLDYH